MGEASRAPDADHYEHGHDYCDLLVVGTDVALAVTQVPVSGINWLGESAKPPSGGIDITIKLRSTQAPLAARLYGRPNGAGLVELAAPEFGIAPGQAAVFYDDTRLLGGGWIERAELAEVAA